ncbi:MAG TPA: helix-turn-helix domain-containing protein [Polyangiaceae bacterium]|jgi:AraC-like DNA-binding protein|nr:helix-turn-helix domain-containing protein [Polyangiaceae bacterium]
MHSTVVHEARLADSATAASGLAGLFLDERERDTPGVALPRPEIHVVARFGPSTNNGVDVHAFGARQHVHRKLLRRGQRSVSARLELGTAESVLGVAASELAGQVVQLDVLWGPTAAERLYQQLAEASDTASAAGVLQRAILERLVATGQQSRHRQLALQACQRLTKGKVNAVATELGVSERQLRRVFRDAIGMSPKEFAKLTRFQRALGAARVARQMSWASIAAAAGYYDQAHLIGEFRSIAGVTPRALVEELCTATSIG